MAGSLGMATMQPFSSSMAGQRLVARNSNVSRPSNVRTNLIQCRTLEAGKEGNSSSSGLSFCGACAMIFKSSLIGCNLASVMRILFVKINLWTNF